MFNVVNITGNEWNNVHLNSYLVSEGVEQGDQLMITVRNSTNRFHFGDAQPTDESGYVRVESDDSIITREGVDCWVLGPATLQVRYAP